MDDGAGGPGSPTTPRLGSALAAGPAAPPPRTSRRWLVGLLAALLVLAACGDSADDEPAGGPEAEVTTRDGARPGSGSPVEAANGGTDAFPVTIPHAFGGTTIDRPPQRVVTWGWGSADAAIALGVVPVAIPFQAYGGDEAGVLPWLREALAEQGADVPTVLPNVSEPPFEAIAAAQPDLILAPYSGISEDEHRLLSDIAPTVAYPDQPWATPWRDTIEIVGQALGRADAAEELLADIDARVAAEADAHPELAGRTVAQVWPTGDAFYVYEPADPRVQFSVDLGLESAPSVDALSTGESTFFFTLSPERLGELTSDVLVLYAETPEQADAFLSSPSAQLMEQVARGAVATITGREFIAAVSPPTALSLTWGLDEYASILAGAAEGIQP